MMKTHEMELQWHWIGREKYNWPVQGYMIRPAGPSGTFLLIGRASEFIPISSIRDGVILSAVLWVFQLGFIFHTVHFGRRGLNEAVLGQITILVMGIGPKAQA
ncbi:hypothetical protein SO802_032116 [Lithocarpus litseifolius]|uniref:Uncharacterized protein n=1 Tax=Lithocarpus litseifolius TaxID=425828 RepID=A0AAW2BSY7_9ROSI